jgi:hypothetical protein
LIDAAPPAEAIALGYADKVTRPMGGTSVTGWLRIANVGSRALDLKTLTVRRVSIEPSPLPTGITIDVSIYNPDQNVVLTPGNSAGLLTNDVKVVVLDAGHMPEPIPGRVEEPRHAQHSGRAGLRLGQFVVRYNLIVEGRSAPIELVVAKGPNFGWVSGRRTQSF